MATTADTAGVTFAPPHCDTDLELCRRFGIPAAKKDDTGAWQLHRAQDGVLWLRGPGPDGKPLAITACPAHGRLAHRLRTVGRKDALARAIGLHRREGMSVVDATAGLGRDAMVLARLGCRVTAIERVPALAALVYAATSGTFPFALEVLAGDAIAWLRALPEAHRPDVVYLDPMFGDAGRAQVKKEMQVCRALASPADAQELWAVARQCARDRVVVKRHHGAADLGGKPSFEVRGERVRFDVYLTATATPRP